MWARTDAVWGAMAYAIVVALTSCRDRGLVRGMERRTGANAVVRHLDASAVRPESGADANIDATLRDASAGERDVGARGTVLTPDGVGDAGLTMPACAAPQGSAADVESFVSSSTAFAVSLYSPSVTAAGAGQNAVVSPFGVFAALDMLDVGAAGNTATQIQTALHLASAHDAPAYAALACAIERDGAAGGNRLSLANSLWGQSGWPFELSFLSTLAGGFGAPLRQADFVGDAAGAAQAVNQWVSTETWGKIPTLLQAGDLTPKTRFIIVNAVYFKGAWDTGFDPKNTEPRPFTLGDGTQVSVPTMNGTMVVAQGAGSEFTAYEIAYKGRAIAMDFLLPATSLASLEAALTPDTLTTALASITPPFFGSEAVYIPKFSFTTRLVLNDVLAGLGVTDAFEPGAADFSAMDGQEDLSVSKVIHQALVQVDEQGTVAAASTAITGGLLGGSIQAPPPAVVIDRPFLFLVRDTKSGTVLFMGRVEDPRQSA